MRARIVVLGLVLILAVATITLQLAAFGNYEEMVEMEYEEYQVKLDYNRMAEGILSLFGQETHSRRSHHEQHSEETQSSADTRNDNTATTLRTAPTVPTVQTLNTMGGEK